MAATALHDGRDHLKTHQAPRTPEELAQVQRFKHLTETRLPALAAEHHWPICLDHCFKRICLDYAFGDVWYKHLQRPAERHLAGEPLLRAIACAEEILEQGIDLLQIRNAASLRYRGKSRNSFLSSTH